MIINDKFLEFFPKNISIVMLHAHADDESFLTAGTIMELLSRGRQVILVYLAAGTVRGQKQTFVRQKELKTAISVISKPKVIFLPYCEPKYPDGMPLIKQDICQVAEDVRKALLRHGVGKYILCSYDKNGGYGNRDHVFVHKVGRMLMQDETCRVRGLEVTISHDNYTNWIQKKRRVYNRLDLPKLEYWTKEFGLPDSEINLIFKLAPHQIKRKRLALAAHVSQMNSHEFPLSLNKADFSRLFGNECYHFITKTRL